MRIALLTTFVALVAAPVFADEVSGTVLAFDRKAGVIVLADKSVFTLSPTDAVAPEGLAAGDMVTITYTSKGDDGYGLIKAIEATN